jgi:hypothetical protein
MRSVTRNLFRILSSEKLLPVQFLDIRLPGTTDTSAIHITDYGQPITWAGINYLAVSMSRGGLEEILSSESGENPQTTINIANVDCGMAAILSSIDINGAEATLWLADRRLLARQRDAIRLTQGEIRDPQLNGAMLTFQICNGIGIAEQLTIPRRLWQSDCNYTFGSPYCGVRTTSQPYTIASTAAAGTSAGTIVVSDSILATAGNPSDLSDFWSHGYIVVTQDNSACTLQGRPIKEVAHAGNTVVFTLRYPFLAQLNVGDAISVRRGCPKTVAACKDRANLVNFGGFPNVPKEKFKPVDKEDPR